MTRSSQKHPFDLFLKDLPKALDALKGQEGLKGFTTVFTGALGEIVAKDVLDLPHASDLVHEYDLASATRTVEVKATRKDKINNVNLAPKQADEVCFVRFEQRGHEIWVAEVFTRPKGTSPGQRLSNSWKIGGDSGREPYRVL